MLQLREIKKNMLHHQSPRQTHPCWRPVAHSAAHAASKESSRQWRCQPRKSCHIVPMPFGAHAAASAQRLRLPGAAAHSDDMQRS